VWLSFLLLQIIARLQLSEKGEAWRRRKQKVKVGLKTHFGKEFVCVLKQGI
jgi:hypothetical protein